MDKHAHWNLCISLGMNKLKGAGSKVCVTSTPCPLLFPIKLPMIRKTNKGALSQTEVPLAGTESLLCVTDTDLAYIGHIIVQGAQWLHSVIQGNITPDIWQLQTARLCVFSTFLLRKHLENREPQKRGVPAKTPLSHHVCSTYLSSLEDYSYNYRCLLLAS